MSELSGCSRLKSAAGRALAVCRRGQTAVEYMLVTVALTVTFAVVYRVLQWYLSRQFRAGGTIILRMYKELPW
jgi:hypothetical protein